MVPLSKADIQASIDSLDYFHDPEAFEKRNQLRGMAKACDAIMLLGARYADYARELAKKENCDTRKAELLQIAANCDVVPAHKPVCTSWCDNRVKSMGCLFAGTL